MPLRFNCPQCHKPIVTFLRWGEGLTCRHCGGEIHVSSFAEETEEKPAWAPGAEAGPGAGTAEGPILDAVVVTAPPARQEAEPPPPEPRTAYADMDPASITRDEARAFIGRNAAYYLDRWALEVDCRGSAIGFNAGAFWLTGLWLPYRKLYALAIVYYAVMASVVAIEQLLTPSPEGGSGIVGWIVAFVGACVCGTCANRWYLSRARSVVAQVRAEDLPDDEHLDRLIRRGGTNLLAAIGMLALSYLITFGAIASLDVWRDTFVGTTAEPSRLTFNNGELYYSDPVTEQEARRLGEYLVETDFFDGTPSAAALWRTGDTYIFRFCMREGAADDPEYEKQVQGYASRMSRDVFHGAALQVHLCDDEWETVKTVLALRAEAGAPPPSRWGTTARGRASTSGSTSRRTPPIATAGSTACGSSTATWRSAT